MKALRIALVSIACIALSACAVWTRIDAQNATLAGPGDGWFVDAPAGWVHLALYSDGIRITRDGFQIQMIDATLSPHARVLEHSKKATSDKLLPSELAEALIAELRGTPGLANLTVQENVPARIAGQNGFRARLQFRNDRGVAFSVIMAGVALPQGRLVFYYQAIDRHFFARDLPVFEQFMQSWRTRRKA